MKLLHNIGDSLNPQAVNEVTYDINDMTNGYVNAQWTCNLNSYSSTPCKICSNLWPIPKISVLMPSNVWIHRQVLLNDAQKFQKETKTTLYELSQKYDTTTSKSQ